MSIGNLAIPTIQYPTVRELMDDKWKETWKKRDCPQACLDGLGKSVKNLSQRKCPGKNSNCAPPKYRCMTLLLHQCAQCLICITNMNVFLFPKFIIRRIMDSSSQVLYVI